MTDPDRPVTRRELREELEIVLKTHATKEDLKAGLRELRDGLRTHFNVVAENFRSEFGSLHDWVEANTNSLATRVEHLENRPK